MWLVSKAGLAWSEPMKVISHIPIQAKFFFFVCVESLYFLSRKNTL